MQTIRRKIITKTKIGMRLFLLSAFVLIMSTFASYAVEPEAKKLSFTVETGMFGSVANTIDSRWQIRKSAWSYYDYSYSNSSGTYNDLQIYYVTVKPEYLLFDDKLCVSAGLRCQCAKCVLVCCASGLGVCVGRRGWGRVGACARALCV